VIQNVGRASAEDVVVTLWATALFAARTDILAVNHVGGVRDADCSAGLYEARLMQRGESAVPSSLSTESQALLIQCKKLRQTRRGAEH